MRKLGVLALVAGGLIGCANNMASYWDLPPGGSAQQFHADNIECMQTAYSTVPSMTVFGPPLMIAAAMQGQNNQRRYVDDECMEAKGYVKVAAPSRT
jgi:hypothetical protein